MDQCDLAEIIAAWLNEQGYQSRACADTNPPYISVQNYSIYCTMSNMTILARFYKPSGVISLNLADPEALDKLLQAIRN